MQSLPAGTLDIRHVWRICTGRFQAEFRASNGTRHWLYYRKTAEQWVIGSSGKVAACKGRQTGQPIYDFTTLVSVYDVADDKLCTGHNGDTERCVTFTILNPLSLFPANTSQCKHSQYGVYVCCAVCTTYASLHWHMYSVLKGLIIGWNALASGKPAQKLLAYRKGYRQDVLLIWNDATFTQRWTKRLERTLNLLLVEISWSDVANWLTWSSVTPRCLNAVTGAVL